jgi:hypothetical protein
MGYFLRDASKPRLIIDVAKTATISFLRSSYAALLKSLSLGLLFGGWIHAADTAPYISSFDVTISGVMPTNVATVHIGMLVVTPRNGAYTAQVQIASGIRHAQLVVLGKTTDGTVVISRQVEVDLVDVPTGSN